jgi:hypothetical protein
MRRERTATINALPSQQAATQQAADWIATGGRPAQ